jgi:phosphopantothenoylcysteine decarboxylase/phosphopantothenate--cysteine ligase
MGGPVLAKKGRAKSAPPTDPDAINHLVSGKQTPPEPFLEELTAPNLGANAAELLDGQPDFDLDPEHRPLFGKHILVTAGPTHEPIDPVRYIANRSSGKQGYAIAAAAARAGARVTLVSGPVTLPTPPGVDRIDVETAREMAAAVKKALPADAAVMVAAVADWRTSDFHGEKIKKRGSAPPALMLTENPDILASVSAGKHRPALLIGFAAETEDVLENAKDKRKRKGVDWIVANDVSGGSGKSVMGGDANLVHIITSGGVESLPEMSKEAVALALMDRIADAFNK